MSLFRKILPAAAALVVGAASLGAQAATKPVCDVDASKGNLAKASFLFEQVRGAQGTPAMPTHLTNTVKTLEAATGEDAVAQALFLGQTLAFWLGQPNEPLTPTRGSLGFTKNPSGTIDLISTIDSLFTIVEHAKPACVELTSAYRGGLPGYIGLVNNAITALNNEKLDSAVFLASQANKLFPASPYGDMVLGNVAAKRNDNAKAIQYWTSAAASAAKDSLYRDVQRQVLQSAGTMMLSQANTLSGAARNDAARKAASFFQQMIAVPGTKGLYLSYGRQNYQNALLLVGDTAAVTASYAPLLANPSAYEYNDLLNSAVTAARANRSADAAKLFDAVLGANPYSRDALFNLAVTNLAMDKYDAVAPVVTRLVAVDPGNPENYYLAARAYLAMAKAAEKAKKNPLVVAYNDSTTQWLLKGGKLPVEVTVSEFSTGEKSVTIAGNVLDRRDKLESGEGTTTTTTKGKKAKAPAKPAPKAELSPVAVTLKFEALDKTGKVLGTSTVTTDPLTPGKSGSFRTTIDAPNAVAYRYTLGS